MQIETASLYELLTRFVADRELAFADGHARRIERLYDPAKPRISRRDGSDQRRGRRFREGIVTEARADGVSKAGNVRGQDSAPAARS